ncbi:hypothetical protein LTS12_025128 [Elasticomyces elasticus]|nr:hypothetical protein LTS12_025128 [Elasticomyces elasticus]
MGIHSNGDNAPAVSTTRAFAKDVLSFVIEGPNHPQLTVADISGLIQNVTKGVSEQDKEMVAEITDFYIKQRRTICLAVIQATDDYANQPVLTKVREVDAESNRTLGIITKPDRLPAGSGTEEGFIAPARNEDVFFKLGWHVVKSRKSEESQFSIEERNDSEARLFRTLNFQVLRTDCSEIGSLGVRLTSLLFDHVKRELPNFRQDLDVALAETDAQLGKLGASRASAIQCQQYLTPAEEKAMVDFVFQMSDLGISVRIKYIPSIALTVTRGRPEPDRRLKPLRKNWARSLEKWHARLRAEKVKEIDWDRHNKNIFPNLNIGLRRSARC